MLLVWVLPLVYLWRWEVGPFLVAATIAALGPWLRGLFPATPAAVILVHLLTLQASLPGWSSELATPAPTLTKLAKVSVMLAAADEPIENIQRTLDRIFNNTPASLLADVVVVDDASAEPIAGQLEAYPGVVVVRTDVRQGVAKARILGAERSAGDVLVFLDAHTAPQQGWLAPLLREVAVNPNRVAVPMMPPLIENSWTLDESTLPSKVMIDWSLHAEWYEDFSNEVAVLGGSSFMIMRSFWDHLGGLDGSFEGWGGEQLEFSFRIWLCGGEIRLARDSVVAHVYRDKLPYEVDPHAVDRNYARVVDIWMDEYAARVYEQGLDRQELDLTSQRERRARLQCDPFSKWVDRFRSLLVLRHMIQPPSFELRALSGCLTAQSDHLTITPCRGVPEQKFTRLFREHLRSVARNACLDAAGGNTPLVYACIATNRNQQWLLKAARASWGSLCLAAAEPPGAEGVVALQICDYEPTGDARQAFEVFNLSTGE